MVKQKLLSWIIRQLLFLEQVERAGISAKELLIGYEVILIPNWISEEICDSIYRKNFY